MIEASVTPDELQGYQQVALPDVSRGIFVKSADRADELLGQWKADQAAAGHEPTDEELRAAGLNAIRQALSEFQGNPPANPSSAVEQDANRLEQDQRAIAVIQQLIDQAVEQRIEAFTTFDDAHRSAALNSAHERNWPISTLINDGSDGPWDISAVSGDKYPLNSDASRYYFLRALGVDKDDWNMLVEAAKQAGQRQIELTIPGVAGYKILASVFDSVPFSNADQKRGTDPRTEPEGMNGWLLPRLLQLAKE